MQLAAPKSEGEAKALIKRFQSRFAGAIGGATLAVRKAERHGETIYRVRAVRPEQGGGGRHVRQGEV